jgi:hypothetical protein
MFNSLMSDFSTPSSKDPRLRIDSASFESPSHPDQTDRLFLSATGWTCDTTHSDGEVRRAMCERTFSHLSDDRFAYCAMLFKRLC